MDAIYLNIIIKQILLAVERFFVGHGIGKAPTAASQLFRGEVPVVNSYPLSIHHSLEDDLIRFMYSTGISGPGLSRRYKIALVCHNVFWSNTFSTRKQDQVYK